MNTEEIQEAVGLRAAGSEMDIGDKQSAKAPFRTVAHVLSFHVERLSESRDRAMTR
jgi:hypothetical protein